MKRYTVTKANFLNWYFNSGADQEQSQTRTDLGERVVDALISDHQFTITAKDIWDECEHECIPLNILEEFEDNEEGELSDLEHEYKVILI